MELIDIKKMYENEIEQKQLDIISKSFKEDIELSFYGYTLTKTYDFFYSSFQMYFIPCIVGVDDNDILDNLNNTYYGSYKEQDGSFLYSCNMDFIPNNFSFIDVFGFIDDSETQENISLEFKIKEDIFVYEYSCYEKSKTILLGKLARIDENFWKFHPLFYPTIKNLSEIKSEYKKGKFL